MILYTVMLLKIDTTPTNGNLGSKGSDRTAAICYKISRIIASNFSTPPIINFDLTRSSSTTGS
jgi:hypothetical protein